MWNHEMRFYKKFLLEVVAWRRVAGPVWTREVEEPHSEDNVPLKGQDAQRLRKIHWLDDLSSSHFIFKKKDRKKKKSSD